LSKCGVTDSLPSIAIAFDGIARPGAEESSKGWSVELRFRARLVDEETAVELALV
jgi:hypothetical protein